MTWKPDIVVPTGWWANTTRDYLVRKHGLSFDKATTLVTKYYSVSKPNHTPPEFGEFIIQMETVEPL